MLFVLAVECGASRPCLATERAAHDPPGAVATKSRAVVDPYDTGSGVPRALAGSGGLPVFSSPDALYRRTSG
ncbi:hypothetical protein SAMD00023353_2900710 [Rosellinia necatrix]|uniref:Uncharacterized protein n=1 Tax=Rosellinia necatrix TaxID=77044 RepID=A0A1S8A8E0_ROSNE|nr:hypothetical protein SAMD00023353_2900710 [Rosellinia necatrix]